MERIMKPFLPGIDFAGLKDENGKVVLVPDTYNYIRPLNNDYYLVSVFCFYGIIKKVELNDMISFIKIIPAQYHWIECLPNNNFKARKGKVYYCFDDNGCLLSEELIA